MDELYKRIRQEIKGAGVISFARFMELALYCPEFGYYERTAHSIGHRGDFYTSVATGGLFGNLLAWQFAEWTGNLAEKVQWVEAGAHTGQLAADILTCVSQTHADLYARLEYWIVEPSPRRQAWQEQRLEKFAGHVFWAKDLQSIPGGVDGVIFSNELLDALPVHRLAWDAGKATWLEWGVTLKAEEFAWQKMLTKAWNEDLTRAGITCPAEVLAVVPDGFTIEHCPKAAEWWGKAAKRLNRGRLLTIDYGLTEEELLSPERAQGTLRGYSRHHVSSDPLKEPGAQDITAHVNYTSLQRTGEHEGLHTEGLLTQAQFFTRIASQIWSSGLAAWGPKENRELQTLIHPEFLGRFRVLIQAR